MKTGMKHDAGKIDYSLIDDGAEAETAAVLTVGAVRYARDNWALVDDAENRYFAAVRRHLSAYRSGEELDPDDGLHHLAHAACCVHFLLALALRKMPDDLPARFSAGLARAREAKAKRINEELASKLAEFDREVSEKIRKTRARVKKARR